MENEKKKKLATGRWTDESRIKGSLRREFSPAALLVFESITQNEEEFIVSVFLTLHLDTTLIKFVTYGSKRIFSISVIE